MRPRLRTRRLVRYVSSALLLVATVVILVSHFISVNWTGSFPVGLYLKTHEKAGRGDLVLYCPDAEKIFEEAFERKFIEGGVCPSGLTMLLKRIAAVGGDRVRIDADGVRVNGGLLACSTRGTVMRNALPLPYDRILRRNEVLLMSPHPLSFDARYFGAKDISGIITTVEPLKTWER